jgi:hypothetical protein
MIASRLRTAAPNDMFTQHVDINVVLCERHLAAEMIEYVVHL